MPGPIAGFGTDIDIDALSRRLALLESRSQDPSNVAIGGGTIAVNVAQLRRAAARYPAKFVRGVSKAIGFGDSYMAGVGATATANAYYSLLQGEFGGRLAFGNYGLGGFPLQRYSSAPLFTTGMTSSGASSSEKIAIASGDISFGIIDLNGLRGIGSTGGSSTNGCGPNPDNYAELRMKAIAMATHFMVPESAKTRIRLIDQSGLNPALTFNGAWTQALGGNNALCYTLTVGGSVSGTTVPGNLIIIRCGKDVGAASTWSFTLDGVVQQPLYAQSTYDTWCESCFVIPTSTNQAHTFTLSHPNADSNSLALISIDCVDTTASDFGATLLYSTPGYAKDGANLGWGLTGYSGNSANAAAATGATAWLYGNGGADRYGKAIDDAMDYLFQLGFNVVKCDHRIGWRTQDMIDSSTIHPNDIGHAHIRNVFAGGLRVIVPA